jgi:diaminohydroxyphosphoribosylaminopyrimidine deaminase/5-amino-6-(5-phosphoribosylamino)uracil reductase
MMTLDERYMKKALALASKGIGKTSPNPAVGCVIVRDGLIIGKGWHRKAGTPHAEVNALATARDAARGADVYVTLEPCCHTGKTPPCSDALINAGVKRLIVGM